MERSDDKMHVGGHNRAPISSSSPKSVGLEGTPSGQSNVPSPLYDCIGIVNHSGSLGAGHYTAFCKNPYDGKWRFFNDSTVTEVKDKRTIVTDKAYLLFYLRKDLQGESMAPGFDYHMATPEEMERRMSLRKKLKGNSGRCAIC